MKYIILEDFSGCPVAFLFPERVDHVDMREQLPYAKTLSAGWVELKNGCFVCSGGCPELDIAYREEDSKIIHSQLS